MPELPDLTVYMERMEDLLVGQELEKVRLKSSFLLRSVEPPLQVVEGRRLEALRRIGKALRPPARTRIARSTSRRGPCS